MTRLVMNRADHTHSYVCFDFLARDVIYTSHAYAMMPVHLSICL